MNKTNIEWTDYSWNPIKGLCPVGCWYCYARRYYKRFKRDEFYGRLLLAYSGNLSVANTFFFDEHELNAPFRLKAKEGKKIFLCSTIELSHPLFKKYHKPIFNIIECNPQHTFIVLTKLPWNIVQSMPDNVWLGVSVTTNEEIHKLCYLMSSPQIKTKLRFVSFEPLLEDIKSIENLNPLNINWAIIGKLTGHGNKHYPELNWINRIVNHVNQYNIPIFLKDNLKEIWGEPLIQEFPI